jgi:uncharacterized coiled-coil protein SlyX
MGNEKYLNYYIETLTATMTDCVIRNVSMQANAKITDEVVKEQTEQIEALVKLNGELQEAVQNLKQTNATNENNAIQELKNKLVESEGLVAKHRQEYDELINKFRDYESVKNQATHVETFKGELIRAREETNRVRTELETRINSISAETNGKISGINEENEKNVRLLIQKHETEKGNLNNKIAELTEKIEYLQLPPAKRKKLTNS